ncbi:MULTISPECIES: hypothetical protein [Nocardiopsis]|uniref:tRNA nuclease CdiA C-terminal domain-containing protein n=1 Tax=Nocardiopsis sinuspersici TaxID=501010 RepID=A0A1V3C7B4_9ACTN|nr:MULTISPECIES: hypothetical protein [Nocardiopsis]OOC56379.1 hypothetical protein NOSIN_23220 [Nocardiopsis sinuspersici]
MSFEPTQPQDGVDSNMFTLIDPEAIPYPLTDVWSLNYAAETLRTGGEDLFGGAEDMRSTWRGLQAHYEAPESEALFSKMDPVVTKGEDISGDLATVAAALEDLAEAAKTARRSLNTLRIEAQGFWNRHHDEKVWWLTEDEETDEWALTENMRLKDAVNAAWATFNEAENDCASRISAVFGGPAYASPGQAGGDGVLVYGLPTDAGERDLSLETAFSFEGVNSFANDAAAWAGSEFHPSQMDWGNDKGQALWDTVVTDALWGSAVGLTTKLGYWHPENGWRFDASGRWENAKAAWDDAKMDAAALIGIHDDHGWLWDPGAGGREGWGAGWDRWTDNLDASKDELWEGHTAWSTREDGTAYSNTTIGANVALMTGGLPLKLAKIVLGTGVGGSGGMPSDGSEGSEGSGDFGGSGGSDKSTSQGGPGTGEWPSSPLPNAGEGSRPTGERFENPLTVLRESLLDPNRFRENPSPSPRPDTPSTPAPDSGGERPSQKPTTPQSGDTPQPQDSGTPPDRPSGEGDQTEPRPDGEVADAPSRPEEKPGAASSPPRPESESQRGETEAPRGEDDPGERPPRRDEDVENSQDDDPTQRRDDEQEGTGGPREEQGRPEPATGGGSDGGGGGDDPPQDRTGTGGDGNADDESHGRDDEAAGDEEVDTGAGNPERLLDVFPDKVELDGRVPRPEDVGPASYSQPTVEDLHREGRIGEGWEYFQSKEKEIAEFLEEYGIQVQSVAESTEAGKKSPEAVISGTGHTVEFKTLDSASANAIRSNIKGGRKQSSRLVLDLRPSGMSQEDSMAALGSPLRRYGGDLDELIVIGGGFVIVWP